MSITSVRGAVGPAARRVRAVVAVAALLIAAVFGSMGVASAETVTHVSGSGTVSYNGEINSFTLDITGQSDGSATGTCTFRGQYGTVIDCTSFFKFQVNAPNKITTYGTAVFNGRPISFSAVVTDGGTGPQDTYTLYTAGRVLGGKLLSGNVSISSSDDGGGQAVAM